MTKHEQAIKYIKDNGFKFNSIENAYIKPIVNDNMLLGIILVRDFGNTILNPIFRANGKVYLSLPTLDHIGDLLDKYDRALTRIELGY